LAQARDRLYPWKTNRNFGKSKEGVKTYAQKLLQEEFLMLLLD
jgi:hypothetical protein